MKQCILFLLLWHFMSVCTLQAEIFSVGSTRTFPTPNALYQAGVVHEGDTIEIDGETYVGTHSLAVWQADNLLIRGVNGRPHLKADGKYIQGKGIWVIAGDNVTVEHIEFSGAIVPDKNGAGIRLDGTGITVRHCYFHNNENGILTNNPYAGDILIEYSEFGHNGYGDGFSHNLYVGHVNSLTFRYNYSHHAKVGHNLKSRANENFIYYNRIMDEASGYSSRLIDLSNGGFTIIMGNLLMQGPNAENNTLIGYGKEGLSNDSSHLYVVHNTMVNKRTASCNFLDIQNGTEIAVVHNNIFAGTGTTIKGTATSAGSNITSTVIDALGFEDEPGYDYHILVSSPAVDSGEVLDPVDGYSLTPEYGYGHPTDSENRPLVNGRIDVGAYESLEITSIPSFSTTQIIIFPNPVQNELHVNWPNSDIQTIRVLSLEGKLFFEEKNINTLSIQLLSPGIYLLQINHSDGSWMNQKFVKI